MVKQLSEAQIATLEQAVQSRLRIYQQLAAQANLVKDAVLAMMDAYALGIGGLDPELRLGIDLGTGKVTQALPAAPNGVAKDVPEAAVVP